MNAEQIAKLKWLAEAATSGDQSHESRLARTEQFYKAIGPHTVLSLIALAERTTSPVSELTDEQAWEVIKAEQGTQVTDWRGRTAIVIESPSEAGDVVRAIMAAQKAING